MAIGQMVQFAEWGAPGFLIFLDAHHALAGKLRSGPTALGAKLEADRSFAAACRRLPHTETAHTPVHTCCYPVIGGAPPNSCGTVAGFA